jgi:serine/threonine-protein kinase PknG
MAILDIPKVPEDKRYCSSCGDPVGRTRTGKPGRPEGFCPSCGQRYSFAPKLQAGDLIADQYQVTGCLAHGGLGWIYLATDRNVSDRWVVLKGLLDSGDSAVAAAAAAVAEQRFLAEVEHPNIVKIFNFVEHDGADYIVMEYVGGASLKDMLKQRRAAAGGVADPLPLAQAIAYMLEILPAFSYMHEHDLLLCDFKPDNVIQTPEQLKLIDLGAVLRSGEDSADVYGTVGFQAPEISAEGPSVESDLYTVARSLAVLSTDFRGYQSTFAHSLPDRADVDCYTQFESYYRLLVKATATDPAERFHSADDMAEQLLGVLREVLAADGDLHPAPSRLFTAELRAELATADWRALPLPLLDLEDPAAAFLGTLTVTDPAQLIGLLDKAPQRTPEVDWRAVRTLIDIATGSSAPSYGHVHNRLAEIVELYGVNWRTSWYNGVLALAEGRYDDAVHCFDDVLSQLPGELAPKLALAMAAELNGDYGRAAGYYDTVSATDPAYTNACAGLARCRALAGDRSAAVAAYSRIPDTSSAYGASQIGAVRALVAPGSAIVELEQAEQLLADLPASALEVAGLRAKLFEQVLVAITASETLPPSLFGDQPLTGEEAEHYVRLQLETCYRTQGRAAERAEKIRLVDAANAVRPRTLT